MSTGMKQKILSEAEEVLKVPKVVKTDEVSEGSDEKEQVSKPQHVQTEFQPINDATPSVAAFDKEDSDIAIKQRTSSNLCEDILPSEVALECHFAGVHGVPEQDPSVAGEVPKDLRKYEKNKKDYKIKSEELLGHGNFSDVNKAWLKNTKENIRFLVAVKSPRNIKRDFNDFMEEIRIMTQKIPPHDNIVICHGFYMKHEKNDLIPCLICEYMDCGSLYNIIKNGKINEDIALTLNDKLKFCQDIANGMVHLINNRLVHRDLAARNCLVNSRKVLKITDFGLTRRIQKHENLYKYKRTGVHYRQDDPYLWRAPEVISKRADYTEKADVWSYGVTLWEIFSDDAKEGKAPFHEIGQELMKNDMMKKKMFCYINAFQRRIVYQKCSREKWMKSIQMRRYAYMKSKTVHEKDRKIK